NPQISLFFPRHKSYPKFLSYFPPFYFPKSPSPKSLTFSPNNFPQISSPIPEILFPQISSRNHRQLPYTLPLCCIFVTSHLHLVGVRIISIEKEK
ncbi:hypothetical protein ES319_A01G168800v1, partial [Gossypium barbadense]